MAKSQEEKRAAQAEAHKRWRESDHGRAYMKKYREEYKKRKEEKSGAINETPGSSSA